MLPVERPRSPQTAPKESGIFVPFSPEGLALPFQGETTGFKVYLIHFDTPYKHARHYLGYSYNLTRRLQQHRSHQGARLMEVVQQAGITWHVSQTWDGGRELETALKVSTTPAAFARRVFRSG